MKELVRSVQLTKRRDLPMAQLYVMHNGVHWVLDADTETIGADGTKVQLWPWNGQGNQKWVLEPSSGLYSIRCTVSNRVLDAEISEVQQNGCKIQLWEDFNNENQRWTLQGVGNGAYFIKNALS